MKLKRNKNNLKLEINLPASKSESNRVLIINKLAGGDFSDLPNLSQAEDTKILLSILKNNTKVADVGHAGTAMRFLTAYFAVKNQEIELTGSKRMQERPIKVLVDALNCLGGNINYLGKHGYPPLYINSCDELLKGDKITIDASVSSQYLSALLMVAPYFSNGLEVRLDGGLVSKPYVDMTIQLMQYFGVEVQIKENSFFIPKQFYLPKVYTVESDWSAASYWFEIASLSETCEIQLNGLKKDSFQGDIALVSHYDKLGVQTEWNDKGILLKRKEGYDIKSFDVVHFDLIDTPDLAQTLICSCAALGINSSFTGLSTLKIKETDRLLALKNELHKMGVELDVNSDSATLYNAGNLIKPSVPINTYDDHRMAMSFAPLALVVGKLEINDSDVVKKSYPTFWEDMKAVFDVVS